MKKSKRKAVKKIRKSLEKPKKISKLSKNEEVQQGQTPIVKNEVQPSIENKNLNYNLKDSLSEEEMLKRKILEYSRKKTYISSVFQNTESNQIFRAGNK